MTTSIHRITDRTAGNDSSFAGRLGVLLYGATIYVAFLVTFLYAIGFVTGFGVPKGIDDGTPAPLVEALIVNGLCLAAFAIQHTIMARPAFKRWWTAIIPKPAERATFVLATCAILCTMYWVWRPLPEIVWQVTNPIAAGALWAACALGWVVVLVSTFLIDHFELFGLRQVVDHFRQVDEHRPEFQERSLYRLVRHPLLLGFLIAFWCTPVMTLGHLFFAIMTTGYVFVGIQFEERDLVGAHGSSYNEYRRRVPMILPLGQHTSA